MFSKRFPTRVVGRSVPRRPIELVVTVASTLACAVSTSPLSLGSGEQPAYSAKRWAAFARQHGEALAAEILHALKLEPETKGIE